MADRIQQRRDTAARWAQFNPILLEGEVGYVTDDPNQYKIGDGVHTWNELPLRGFDGTLVHELGDSETAAMSQKGVTEVARKFILASSELTAKNLSNVTKDAYYYNNDGSISDAIPFADIDCGYFDISKGDMILLNNLRGSVPRAYYITDMSGNILEQASKSYYDNPEIIVISNDNAARLYYNLYQINEHPGQYVAKVGSIYKELLVGVRNVIPNMQNDISKLSERITNNDLAIGVSPLSEKGYYYPLNESIVGEKNSFTNIDCGVIDIKKGDIIVLNNRGGSVPRAYAITDSEGNILKADSAGAVHVNDTLVITQENATKLYYNLYQINEHPGQYVAKVGEIYLSLFEKDSEIEESLSSVISAIQVYKSIDLSHDFGYIPTSGVPHIANSGDNEARWRIISITDEETLSKFKGKKLLYHGWTYATYCISYKEGGSYHPLHMSSASSGQPVVLEDFDVEIPNGITELYISWYDGNNTTDTKHTNDFLLKTQSLGSLQDLSDSLQDLSDSLQDLSDSLHLIPATKNHYYGLNTGVVQDIVAFNEIDCASIDVSVGDVFIYKGKGGLVPRAYAIADSEGNILEVDPVNGNHYDVPILIKITQENAAKLYVNFYQIDGHDTPNQFLVKADKYSYLLAYLSDSLQDLSDSLQDLSDSLHLIPATKNHYYGLNTGVVQDIVAFNEIDCASIDVSVGDVFIYKGKGGLVPRAYAIADSEGNILEVDPVNGNHYDVPILIKITQENAAKLYVNFYQIDGHDTPNQFLVKADKYSYLLAYLFDATSDKRQELSDYCFPTCIFSSVNSIVLNNTYGHESEVRARNYANTIYADRLYKNSDAVFDGVKATQLLSDHTRWKYTLQNVSKQTISLKLSSKNIKDKAVSFPLITTKNEVAVGKTITCMSIGDSITAGDLAFWDGKGTYGASWAYWNFVHTLFAMDNIDYNKKHSSSGDNVKYISVGTVSEKNPYSFEYEGETVTQSDDYCEGRSGWSLASYLRHPINTQGREDGEGFYDILGLKTVNGDWNGSNEQRYLIGATCWGEHTPDITEASWNMFRSRIGLGSTSWSEATSEQKQQLSTWATSTIIENPDNPFFGGDITNDETTGRKYRFSWSSYYNRYKTHEDDGITELVTKGTNYKEKSLVCVPKFITICLGTNDSALSIENNIVKDLKLMANLLRISTNAKIIFIANGQTSSQIPQYFNTSQFSPDSSGVYYNRHKALKEDCGSLENQKSSGIYYLPSFFVQGYGTSADHRVESWSGERDYDYTTCSGDIHPGVFANKQIGYQMYCMLLYLLSD
jgi:hypothetical protein